MCTWYTTSTGCTTFRQARGTLGDKRVHLLLFFFKGPNNYD